MSIPFIQAKHFRATDGRRIDWIVVHDMEVPETTTSAEAVAWAFARGDRVASCHYCVDANSIVQCVREQDVAFHAPPNDHSIGVEHAGFARQTREQWLDTFGKAMLKRSAALVAELLTKYDLPPVWLSVDDLKAGRRGVTTHRNISRAFGQSTHTDPGPNFPRDDYMAMVRLAFAGTNHPAWWTTTLRRDTTDEAAVRVVQQKLGRVQTGVYGWMTWWSVRGFQQRHGLKVTGNVDRRTAVKLGD